LIIPRLARCSIWLTLGKLRRQVKKTNLHEAIRDICFTSAKISHEVYPEHRRRVRDDNLFDSRYERERGILLDVNIELIQHDANRSRVPTFLTVKAHLQ